MAKIHNWRIAAGLTLCTMVFAGCGGAAKLPDVIENTSLRIDKDGGIESYTVGVFDKDYYDLEEMRRMGVEEVAEYNAGHQTGETAPLVLEEISNIAGSKETVLLSYSYDSARTYQDYHERKLFYGTVDEAVSEGYDFQELNQVLLKAEGGGSIVSGDLEGMGKKHVVLLEEATRVYCPYKVAYFSDNAAVMEDGSIDTSGIFPEEYPVIIVLDK